MKHSILLAAALLAAACTPKSGRTTTLTGRFDGENAPSAVDISVPGVLDTTVIVTDGLFKVEIPRNVTVQSVVRAGDEPIAFLSDGTTITIDPEEGTAVSSSRKGLQSRFAAYNEWGNRFMADYRDHLAEIGEDADACEAYFKESVEVFNEYQEKVAKENPDNVLGLLAIQQIVSEDPDDVAALLAGLSDEMKATPQAARLIEAFEKKARTAEGSPFVDFTVVQDPEHPETSTVRLSDYVGKGKVMLVDFWASWCGPCAAEMPNIARVWETYRGERFDVLSIAVADDAADSKAAARELGIAWNQIVNAQHIPLDLYGIESIPHLILFGPDGTILKRGIRGEEVGEAVREALGL